MIWTRRTSTDEQRQRSEFTIRHKLRDEKVVGAATHPTQLTGLLRSDAAVLGRHAARSPQRRTCIAVEPRWHEQKGQRGRGGSLRDCGSARRVRL
jgi:hypothetical protein